MLKPLDESHLEELRQIRSDPEIGKWLISPSVHISARQQERWFKGYLKDETVRLWVLVEDGAVQGYGQLKHIDLLHLSAELGVVIAPAYQSQGKGKAITKGLLEIAQGLGIHRVWLRLFQDNVGALRLYLDCGFAVEGILRDGAFKDGEFKNLIVMGRLNDD